jgi:hypothetical protein
MPPKFDPSEVLEVRLAGFLNCGCFTEKLNVGLFLILTIIYFIS